MMLSNCIKIVYFLRLSLLDWADLNGDNVEGGSSCPVGNLCLTSEPFVITVVDACV